VEEEREGGFISVSPNLNTKLRYGGKRAQRIIKLLYFAFSVSFERYSVDKIKSKLFEMASHTCLSLSLLLTHGEVSGAITKGWKSCLDNHNPMHSFWKGRV